MTTIQYLNGDATAPKTGGTSIIAHVCNDRGGWGKGFVLAISKRWSAPEHHYRQWYAGRAGNDFKLGAVQFVNATPQIWVANMIGQHGMTRSREGPPIRYEAVQSCLRMVAEKAKSLKARVHMPRI